MKNKPLSIQQQCEAFFDNATKYCDLFKANWQLCFDKPDFKKATDVELNEFILWMLELQPLYNPAHTLVSKWPIDYWFRAIENPGLRNTFGNKQLRKLVPPFVNAFVKKRGRPTILRRNIDETLSKVKTETVHPAERMDSRPCEAPPAPV